jgi:hypothetical protein
VKYASVYPGIDVNYHGNQRLLEYDFVVAPGADPQAIDIRFQGAKKLSVNGEGHLVISVGDSEVIEHAPVVYQETGGQRQIVAGRYVLRGKGRVGFSVGAYDRSQPLVIDPTLEYSALLSGSAGASILGIAVDTSGSAYVTGYTNSSDFPTTPGAFQTTIGGAFVTKLNVAGSALLYSTYLGGDNAVGLSIAVDASGDTYITGCAYRNFPTTPGAFQTTYRAFNGNAFVTKLNAAGSALLYSTYLGGSSAACGVGIAIDASGDAYIAGDTYDLDFPTTAGAFQITPVGRPNAFVSKLNSAGSALVYSTFLGGNGSESGVAIAVDASGNAYVTGSTWSTNFSVTPDAFQTTSRAPDVFVSKLNAAGSALLYSTYFGGSGPDMSNAIAIDSSGSAYVIGWAGSSDFPTPPGSFQTKSGLYSPDFISKFSFGTSITGAPVTIATLSGSAGNHGWYLSGVTVTLSATDPNSSVSATYYSVDAGAYHAYGAPFSISTDGSH